MFITRYLTFFILLISLTFIVGCREKTPVNKKGKAVTLDPPKQTITSYSIHGWGLNNEISSGFSMKVSVPDLSDDDREFLYAKYKADSWIFRIKKGRNEYMGHIFVPFLNAKYKGGRYPLIKDVILKVFYAAASISKRVRTLKCPMLDHRKKIVESGIEGITTFKKTMVVAAKNVVKGKVYKNHQRQEPFNGGMTLRGEYKVEYAMYSYETNTLFSDFIQMDKQVVISREKESSIPGCR